MFGCVFGHVRIFNFVTTNDNAEQRWETYYCWLMRILLVEKKRENTFTKHIGIESHCMTNTYSFHLDIAFTPRLNFDFSRSLQKAIFRQSSPRRVSLDLFFEITAKQYNISCSLLMRGHMRKLKIQQICTAFYDR